MAIDPEIERRFVYYAPNGITKEAHEAVRAKTLMFAREMDELLGTGSREKSLFFTELETASFWAHAHIARNL